MTQEQIEALITWVKDECANQYTIYSVGVSDGYCAEAAKKSEANLRLILADPPSGR